MTEVVTADLPRGQELVLRYSDPDSRFGGDGDGRCGRIVLIDLAGVFGAGTLLLLLARTPSHAREEALVYPLGPA